MATKRNHALKRQQYGTPLPLPALQQLPQTLPPITTPRSTVPADPARAIWTPPLSPILAIIRFLYHQWDTKDLPSRSLIQGYFHPSGASVWIHESKDIEVLFRQGFFGKGTLSRSEATWTVRTTEGFQGVSLEDITRRRRAERAQVREKLASSQHQQQQQQQQQGNLSTPTSSESPSGSPLTTCSKTPLSAPPDSTALKISPGKQLPDSLPYDTTKLSTTSLTSSPINIGGIDQGEDYEHLQLSLEEAFFLVFAVECIAVSSQTTTPCNLSGSHQNLSSLSIQECWLRFAEASVLRKSSRSSMSLCMPEISPDNPFIIRYAAYHHYRSQGWVVKDGLKYGTDYLLYKKGMVFGHSQFGVRVIALKSATEVISSTIQHQSIGVSLPGLPTCLLSSTPGQFVSHAVHSWQWLLALNRVISQVQKSAILCHVIVPQVISEGELSRPLTALPMYTIVEVGVKRFLPEKNRA
ncbi:MAG: hypothetical protein J3R72DRAFT_182018 [Linnemannia gamsii]|nr:MAG: hypothetical protein J3R72DRAFT_182018 [Linnemannia gamsii]